MHWGNYLIGLVLVIAGVSLFVIMLVGEAGDLRRLEKLKKARKEEE